MEKQELEQCASVEDGNHLNRNRSFKTKQLVRSQAIRESTSPPRTVSPSVRNETASDNVVNVVTVNVGNNVNKVTAVDCRTDKSDSSHDSDVYSYNDRRKPVEIQITQGAWDEAPPYELRGRNGRWHSDSSRDLLSNNPRVACVCGACAHCPQCRGRRRRLICTIKQDSGICTDECPECSDTEPNGVNEITRKAASLDVDDQYYCRCPERRDRPKNMLSKTDSDEKTEPTGPELVTFIKETLNKSGKDRTTLLKVEKELHSLVNDTGRCIVKFPVMTSYGRMLVHRCAALFQLSHHIDQYNKTCVIVSKSGTSGGRIPCTNFKTWCIANFPPPSPQRHQDSADGANAKSILKRDTHSLDEPSTGASAMNRSKSLEQREKEYERARRRIFSTDNCSQDEAQWPWVGAGPVKVLTPDAGRNKLLKVQSLENSVPPSNWRGSSGVVSKSHSFGGYGEPPPSHGRTLSRQGDLASSSWRLSPSSSGYKTLSLRSTDSVTPSPTGGGTPEPSQTCPVATIAPNACGGPVVWAVTDITCVPIGAMVIHPQTGRPLTNPDGSVYHFDPSNPPVLYDPPEYDTETTKIDLNNEKRRGRLEKQQSFIDHEAECQQTEEYYCQYQEQETQEPPPKKETPKPHSPTKNRYEPEYTNQKPAEPEPANQTPDPVNQTPEPANQTPDPVNQKPETYDHRHKYQDTVYYGPYAHVQKVQDYNIEMTSPPQLTRYIQPDIATQNMVQGKMAAITQDPNIRPLSLGNMVYPANVPPGYQFVPNPNQCRVEPLPPPLYQPLVQSEDKPLTPQTADTTFRIDPSYPYAPVPVEYTAAYGACVDPTTMHSQPPQRSYSVPYNPAELSGIQPSMPPVYPLGANVILPQPMQYPVQYQEAVQWTPIQTQPICPVVYPQPYTHYNIVYPQVLPQPYPLCQPVYPVVDKTPYRKRNSLPRATATTPEEKPYEKFDRQNQEIAAKINQIKDQMMLKEGRREEWRRNSGNGILGSYPVNSYSRISGVQDNTQLSSAARAIVNSIRHLQAKNTYHQDRHYTHRHDRHDGHDRPDRRRYDDRATGDADRRTDGRGQYYRYERNKAHDKTVNINAQNSYQNTSYAGDGNSNTPDKIVDKTEQNPVQSNEQEKETGFEKCPGNDQANDNRSGYQGNNAQERIINQYRGSTQDRNTYQHRNSYHDRNNTQDRTYQDRNNYHDRNNTQDRNTQDRNTQDRNTQDRNTQDRNTQNRNTQDRNTQDRNTQARNTQDKNTQDRNTQARNTQDRNTQDRNTQDRPWQRKFEPRNQALNPGQYQYRPQYLLRQMSPGTWVRRSPAPIHPGINHPRRPHPDNRNGRRY